MKTAERLTKQEEIALVKEVYENFPESSVCLRCTKWKYDDFIFHFEDEEGEKHIVRLNDAIRGLRLFVAAIDRGELPGLGLSAGYLSDTGEWDAYAFDALNQMAIYGEVVYG